MTTTEATTKGRHVLGKCDYNGSGRKNCKAAITWELKDGRFSASAEIWNPRGTDIYCGGQCLDEVIAFFPHDQKAKRIRAIWDRWHLNDMKSGTQAQEDYLRANPVKAIYPESHYEKAKKALQAAGLEPDPETGYSYGSKWLKEELPEEVVAEILSW